MLIFGFPTFPKAMVCLCTPLPLSQWTSLQNCLLPSSKAVSHGFNQLPYTFFSSSSSLLCPSINQHHQLQFTSLRCCLPLHLAIITSPSSFLQAVPTVIINSSQHHHPCSSFFLGWSRCLFLLLLVDLQHPSLSLLPFHSRHHHRHWRHHPFISSVQIVFSWIYPSWPSPVTPFFSTASLEIIPVFIS